MDRACFSKGLWRRQRQRLWATTPGELRPGLLKFPLAVGSAWGKLDPVAGQFVGETDVYALVIRANKYISEREH